MYCIVKEITIEATRDSKQMSMHKHTEKSTFLHAKVSQPTAFYLSFLLKKVNKMFRPFVTKMFREAITQVSATFLTSCVYK